MVPAWVNQYVGIPYLDEGRTREAVDCWGLVQLVYKDQYGIDLEDIMTEVEAIRHGKWFAVERHGAQEGDVMLFRTGAFQRHVGVAVDEHRMLHSDKNAATCIERYDAKKWSSKLERIYRWRK